MEGKREDSSMAKVRRQFEKAGLSLHDLGLKMGYAPEIARQSAFQFMKSGDPRISMLRRFAKAMRMDVMDLLRERRMEGKTTMSAVPDNVEKWFAFTTPEWLGDYEGYEIQC